MNHPSHGRWYRHGGAIVIDLSPHASPREPFRRGAESFELEGYLDGGGAPASTIFTHHAHLTCRTTMQLSHAFHVPPGVSRITVAGTVTPTRSCGARTTVFFSVWQPLFGPPTRDRDFDPSALGTNGITARGTDPTPFTFTFPVNGDTDYAVLAGISSCPDECRVYYEYAVTT